MLKNLFCRRMACTENGIYLVLLSLTIRNQKLIRVLYKWQYGGAKDLHHHQKQTFVLWLVT